MQQKNFVHQSSSLSEQAAAAAHRAFGRAARPARGRPVYLRGDPSVFAFIPAAAEAVGTGEAIKSRQCIVLRIQTSNKSAKSSENGPY